jgi:NodT family efflux transporter outer membrane factor (OMF) lipoprotein
MTSISYGGRPQRPPQHPLSVRRLFAALSARRRRTRMPVVALAIVAGGLTSACTVGPNYRRPMVQTPSSFRGADPATAGAATDPQSLADLRWAALFNDETLTTLVRTALKQNFDLRIAAERVLQARAQLKVRRADQFPSIDASAGFTEARGSQVGANRAVTPDIDPEVSYSQAGFSLSWELDVWGRLRRVTESARAQYLATEAARRGVVNTLIGDVTEAWLHLRSLDRELEIAQRTRDLATDALRLTELRRDRGVATGLDVRQAQQLLYTATAQIASTEREIAQTENALSLLLGEMPHDVARGGALETLQGPAAIVAGLPSSLLTRRPDIMEAEQTLIAANAEIGVARAEYFPRISLTTFLGGQSRALTDLLSTPARVWTASAGAAAPIFNAGRTRGNVQAAEAVQRAALAAYQRAIHSAFRDVSDSLVGYQKTSEQRIQQEKLVEALRDSTRLSTDRYRGGLDSYLQVLDAQRSLFQGELSLARLREQELVTIVQLYRALGGGWTKETDAGPVTSDQ